jgi:DNA-directed RNA polymerase subunit H (RpoH/RPB5)
MSSSEISSIYKSRNIVLELMETQNYNISDYLGFSINEVNIMYTTKQLDMLLTKTNDTTKIYIKYFLLKALRINYIDEMIEDLFYTEEVLSKKDTLLIITKEEVNETIQNHLKQIWEQDKIFIIVITIKKLQFNILKHSLVPPQRIISDEEVEIVKKKYNIMEDSQWPEISRFDPVMLVIGIKPGEICEIIRPNKCSIVEKYYRICTNN